MQMWAGGESGRTYITDDITPFDFGSLSHFGAAHMSVQGFVSIAVVDNHSVAISAVSARECDFAVSSCIYRSADTGCKINSFVLFPDFENRVNPHAKTR